MGTSWLAEERAAAAERARCDEVAKEQLAGAWSKLYDKHERLARAATWAFCEGKGHPVGCDCAYCEEVRNAICDGKDWADIERPKVPVNAGTEVTDGGA